MLVLIVVPLLAVSGCTSTIHDMLKLEVTQDHNTFSIRLENSGSAPINIWEPKNSWGWSTFYFEVESERERLFIRRKTRDWTKNAPEVLTIPPKEDLTVMMDFLDGWWEREALPRSEGKLRVILEIGFSPEGDSLNVSKGKWISSWIELAPIQ